MPVFIVCSCLYRHVLCFSGRDSEMSKENGLLAVLATIDRPTYAVAIRIKVKPTTQLNEDICYAYTL